MGVFNKTFIISLAQVGYEMIRELSAHAPYWLSVISYPMHAHGIIVKYQLVIAVAKCQ